MKLTMKMIISGMQKRKLMKMKEYCHKMRRSKRQKERQQNTKRSKIMRLSSINQVHKMTSTRINGKEDFHYSWKKSMKLTTKMIITGTQKKKLMKMKEFCHKMRRSRRHIKMKMISYQTTSVLT